MAEFKIYSPVSPKNYFEQRTFIDKKNSYTSAHFVFPNPKKQINSASLFIEDVSPYSKNIVNIFFTVRNTDEEQEEYCAIWETAFTQVLGVAFKIDEVINADKLVESVLAALKKNERVGFIEVRQAATLLHQQFEDEKKAYLAIVETSYETTEGKSFTTEKSLLSIEFLEFDFHKGQQTTYGPVYYSCTTLSGSESLDQDAGEEIDNLSETAEFIGPINEFLQTLFQKLEASQEPKPQVTQWTSPSKVKKPTAEELQKKQAKQRAEASSTTFATSGSIAYEAPKTISRNVVKVPVPSSAIASSEHKVHSTVESSPASSVTESPKPQHETPKPQQQQQSTSNMLEELEKLGKLKAAGIIDEEEFKVMKKRIIGL